MSYNITVESGKSVRLPTAGKYCDRDIIVKATGGDSDGGYVVISDPRVEPSHTNTIGQMDDLKISYPNATTVGSNAFTGLFKIIAIDLPNVTSIGEYAFDGCFALKTMDLPKVTSVDDSAFLSCLVLDTLILRNTETMCNFNLFAIIDTKIVSAEGMPTGEGFIYVPTSLYENYVAQFTEQATALVGDATIAEQMSRAILRKIEDYPDICG